VARSDWRYISVLVIIPLFIGLIVFRDYGESVDENSLYVYSDYSLHAYQGVLNLDLNPDLGKGILRYYGPSFLIGVNIFYRFVSIIRSDLTRPDIWHLAYFLSFQLCVFGLYILARRWFNEWTSFTISLLFLFQPLTWGHAFINPKDIPFMSLCLLSVLSALIMQEKLFPVMERWRLPKISSLKYEWNQSKAPRKVRIIYFSLLVIVILAFLVLGRDWMTQIATFFLTLVYLSEPESMLGKLFSFFAANYQQIPAEFYVPKVTKFLNAILVVFVFILLLMVFAQLRAIFGNPSLRIRGVSISRFVKDGFDYLRNPSVLIAGIVLGLTISVRILGPFLGLIALIVAIYRAKSRAIPAFVSYFLIAFVVTYLTWPYLWESPISRFSASLMHMADFPWSGKVLFNGNYYLPDQLPIGYVPVLFGIQFTEPVVFLFVLGLCLFFYQIWKQSVKIDFVIIILLWGILPFIAFTILRPVLYDNTRQLLFIIPPLFLVVGLALEKLFQSLHNAYINILILVLLLLPGIYPIVRLHPYEYTYYNSFIHDSYRRFEADYWAISFREAIEYLNRVAPRRSKVIVYGPGDADNVSDFARPDLIVDPINGTRYDASNDYQYAIISTRNDRDLKRNTDWETIYLVQRDGNIFTLVKQKP